MQLHQNSSLVLSPLPALGYVSTAVGGWVVFMKVWRCCCLKVY